VFTIGRIYFDSAERVNQKPYTTLNAVASWKPANARWKVEVWGRNLTDKDYLISVYEDATTDGAGYAPPRTYGVSVSYNF
jgi:iron complex outermembrane receptor protein